MNSKSIAVALLSLLVCACGASDARHVVKPRQVEASSGAPEVHRVVDLGHVSAIPAKGAIPTRSSDSTFLIGELVLIEGDDFGKLPTVSIGGKPAKNLARTKNGGIVSRIPQEVAAGVVEVEVSHPDGRDSIQIEVERWLAMASSRAVHLISASTEGELSSGRELQTANATGLAFSHDGQALYIAGEGTLQTVAVVAKGGPKEVARIPMEASRVRALVTRMAVPQLIALGDKGVSIFDTRVPTAIYEAATLALEDGALAAALSPDGSQLAVLGRTKNTLTLVRTGEAPAILAELSLMPNETVPLVRDLVYAPAGDEIWVISGNNRRSTVAGLRDTQIHRVSVKEGAVALLSSADVPQASGPRYLAVSQREAVMAAAAVRSTKQRAALVLSCVSTGLVGGPKAGEASTAQLYRLDLEGHASALADSDAIHSSLAISHDQRWVYSANRSGSSLGVSIVPLEGGTLRFVPLAEDARDALTHIPFAIAP